MMDASCDDPSAIEDHFDTDERPKCIESTVDSSKDDGCDGGGEDLQKEEEEARKWDLASSVQVGVTSSVPGHSNSIPIASHLLLPKAKVEAKFNDRRREKTEAEGMAEGKGMGGRRRKGANHLLEQVERRNEVR